MNLGNLTQISLVKQRKLQRTALDQGANLRRPQRRNPVQPLNRRELFADPGLGQQPPVAHPDDTLESEAAADLVNLRLQCGGVSGVAGKHLHGHRTALGAAQQPKHDLEFALLPVTVVPQPGERAGAPFKVGGGDIVEHQRAVGQVPLGQFRFDLRLALPQPVHGSIEVVFVGRRHPQRLAQTAPLGLGTQPSGRGELGARIDDAGHHQRQHQGVVLGVPATDDAIEPQPSQRSQHGRHMAVRSTAPHIEGLWEVFDNGAPFEEHPQGFDEVVGPFGEVGDGAFLDFALLAIGLA